MEAIILIGIQGAGKSTFYARYFGSTHVRINLDTLKTRKREAGLLHECLDNKRPFVVDNTNVLASDRARYIPLARAAGYRIKGYAFDCPIDDAISRNSQRTGKALIPTVAIHACQARLEPPAWEEGFDELFGVSVSDHHFEVRRMEPPSLR